MCAIDAKDSLVSGPSLGLLAACSSSDTLRVARTDDEQRASLVEDRSASSRGWLKRIWVQRFTTEPVDSRFTLRLVLATPLYREGCQTTATTSTPDIMARSNNNSSSRSNNSKETPLVNLTAHNPINPIRIRGRMGQPRLQRHHSPRTLPTTCPDISTDNPPQTGPTG